MNKYLKKEYEEIIDNYIPYLPGWVVSRFTLQEAEKMDKDIKKLAVILTDKAYKAGQSTRPRKDNDE